MSRSIACLALLTALGFSQEVSYPWPKGDLLQPAVLVRALQSGKAPIVVSVGFPILYRSRHIPHAIQAGPGSKPEGIEALKKAVSGLPKSAEIVIYCGCCPMLKCPNIRPAYQALKQLGFTNVRVLDLPSDLHTDWYAKNYPSEEGGAVR